MQVKFKTTLYDLTDDGVKQTNQPDGSNVLSLTLLNVTDTTALLSEAEGAEDIQILNGSEIAQEYLDYTTLRGLSVDSEAGTVTVTVRQESLVKQVAVLRERNRALAEKNATLENRVSEQAETIEAQRAMIAELEDSQETQNEAIDYLLMGGEDAEPTVEESEVE